MARTAITVTQLQRNAGVAPAAPQAADAANGMQVPAGLEGTLHLRAKNTDTVAHTVTVRAGVHGRAGLGNLAVSVPAGAEREIGPLESMRFEQADEQLYVDFDAATGMTVSAVRLP